MFTGCPCCRNPIDADDGHCPYCGAFGGKEALTPFYQRRGFSRAQTSAIGIMAALAALALLKM